VRTGYGAIARGEPSTSAGGCCGPADGCGTSVEPTAFARGVGYAGEDVASLPEGANMGLSCGNPGAIAALQPGEVVLDLGSGGGIDVILSARRVGATGIAYGLDMTDEMLALARKNAVDADVTNVHFLKGVIEEIPLPADSVDVVISNCVINLSVDKPAVLTEIARVLKPGGRIGISDIVAEDDLTPEERAQRGSYVGCIAGALSKEEYEVGLEAAGFEQISVAFTHEVAERMHGAIVKAVKTDDPQAKGLPVIGPAAKAGCC